MASRRNFIKTTTAAFCISGFSPALITDMVSPKSKNLPVDAPLQMGIAGYTFLNFSIEQSIAMMQRLGITALSIKDFHLPLDSPQQKINELKDQFRTAGISIYAVGVIYMKTEAEVDRAFEYAHRTGVELLVCAPNYELLSYAEQKVKSLNIKMAIHNHGPEDKLYPSPKDAYDRINQMDNRIGLCLDIGHATRAGTDIAKAVIEYAPRIFDLHIKDVSAAVKDGKAVEAGRGVINFPAFVRSLEQIKYSGRCSIEFEKDMKDPLPGIAESVGFFKGVMGTVS